MKPALLLLLTWSAQIAFAQKETDKPGSQDHPLFTRMNNTYIYEYEQNFDKILFKTGTKYGEEKAVEGKKTYLYYKHKAEVKPQPSAFEILKNYENAVKSVGGATLVLDQSKSEATFKLTRNGKDTWVKVHNFAYNPIQYRLVIVEPEPMQQQIVANDLLQSLNTDGFYAVYFQFATDKAELLPESAPLADQLVQFLTANAALKVSIEGHTDNVGDTAYNQSLSERRAKTVYDLLVKKGISAGRLAYKGWGAAIPVADNRKESGRALNRRVEVVKMK
jgi:outer membrane protein OmpA-like peptidoglycan-associated protein